LVWGIFVLSTWQRWHAHPFVFTKIFSFFVWRVEFIFGRKRLDIKFKKVMKSPWN